MNEHSNLNPEVKVRSPRQSHLSNVRRCYAHSMKRAILFLLLSTLSAFADEPWPGVKFSEVRAYAWPDDKETEAVILPGTTLKPGVLNKDGAPLTPAQVSRLRSAVTGKQRSDGGAAGCYIPHNAFVFYDADKKPVAFVEVCFMCLGHRAQPKAPGEPIDFLELASIFDELKIPMGAYPNLEAFKKRFKGE